MGVDIFLRRGKIKYKMKEEIYLPRHARKYYDTSFFHVIVQGLNKENIFCGEKNIHTYLKLLNKYGENTKIEIIAYCMMTNHAHFLIYSPIISELSQVMQKTNTIYAKYYNDTYNRVGYVFRDRYLSEPIDSERYLVKCINYIHNNPVKAGIVDNPAQYKYCSYIEFLNEKKIKLLLELTGIQFDIKQFQSKSILETFIDVDNNSNEIVESAIREICVNDNITLVEIFEKREVLKQVVRRLKNDYHIKYVDIMKKLDIPKGVMRYLK